MKNKFLISCIALAVISLAAYGYISSEKTETETTDLSAYIIDKNVKQSTTVNSNMAFNPVFEDFIYDIGPRFSPITKEEVSKITSFNDLIDQDLAQRITTYNSLSIILFEEEKWSDKKIEGTSGKLNTEQLNFLQSLDYSTSLVFSAYAKEKSAKTGIIEDNHWTPHHTIVPETQATYSESIEVLKKYLKESTTKVREGVDPEKLKPAKLYFTVSADGTLKNTRLDRPSGYPEVDKKMLELMNNLPGTWTPAKNAKGEKVAQELVVSFGLMGC